MNIKNIAFPLTISKGEDSNDYIFLDALGGTMLYDEMEYLRDTLNSMHSDKDVEGLAEAYAQKVFPRRDGVGYVESVDRGRIKAAVIYGASLSSSQPVSEPSKWVSEKHQLEEEIKMLKAAIKNMEFMNEHPF